MNNYAFINEYAFQNDEDLKSGCYSICLSKFLISINDSHSNAFNQRTFQATVSRSYWRL